MNKAYLILLLSLSVLLTMLTGCADDQVSEPDTDGFDRTAMLGNWADNLIMPGYVDYVDALKDLVREAETFIADAQTENLAGVHEAWRKAYNNWQNVSMFEIGKAETIGLRDYTNTYPTNTTEIDEFISTGSFNLQLPSTRMAQGFPAIDYLLYGIEDDDLSIIQRFDNGSNEGKLLIAYCERLLDISSEVLNDWESGYRDAFVQNDGSDGNSSVNKLMNDFMFYFERSLRAGKVGIPAGVFSSTALPDKVEGFYSKEYSRQLLLTALDRVVRFYNGLHHKGDTSGPGVDDYLNFLQSISGAEQLSSEINHQIALAIEQAEKLSEDLTSQIVSDNVAMLKLYDELQKCVVLMKVDMFQAMNIKVDFVDADGD